MKNWSGKNEIYHLNIPLVNKHFVQNWNKLPRKKSTKKTLQTLISSLFNLVLSGSNVSMKNVIIFVNKLLNYKENMMNKHGHFPIDLKQQQHRIVIIFRYGFGIYFRFKYGFGFIEMECSSNRIS
jgi:hypothetical protein